MSLVKCINKKIILAVSKSTIELPSYIPYIVSGGENRDYYWNSQQNILVFRDRFLNEIRSHERTCELFLKTFIPTLTKLEKLYLRKKGFIR